MRIKSQGAAHRDGWHIWVVAAVAFCIDGLASRARAEDQPPASVPPGHEVPAPPEARLNDPDYLRGAISASLYGVLNFATSHKWPLNADLDYSTLRVALRNDQIWSTADTVDCQFSFTVNRKNGAPFSRTVRIQLGKRILHTGYVATLNLVGWTEFVQDPVAFKGLPLVPAAKAPAPGDSRIAHYEAVLSDYTDDASACESQVAPFVANFCLFRSRQQIRDARAVVERTQATNAEWLRLAKAGVLPEHFRDDPAWCADLKRMRLVDGAYLNALQRLLDLAESTFGRVYALPPDEPPANDGQVVFDFFDPAAAKEYQALEAQIQDLESNRDRKDFYPPADQAPGPSR